jgi:very-short-patch-repair endonuclease
VYAVLSGLIVQREEGRRGHGGDDERDPTAILLQGAGRLTMKPADFFTDLNDRADDDPWTAVPRVFDENLVARLRTGSLDDVSDVDAAQALVELARDELSTYGTSGGEKLDNRQMRMLLRGLAATLRRLNIPFEPPFRDFEGFYRYWTANSMRGSWAARRNYVGGLLEPVIAQLEELHDLPSRPTAIRGVDGGIKNIIFASVGPKPEIILRDAINNVIEVVRNGEYCLIYDRHLTDSGVSWGELVDWWRRQAHLVGESDIAVARHLYSRLAESLDNDAEKRVFRGYCERYGWDEGSNRPALLPQVYLHFDPLTREERRQLRKPVRLTRERMDFLLLLRGGIRIVIEVDGKHHYADGDSASPAQYSKMVAEDRTLRLKGYEVYRFGGGELGEPDAPSMLRRFFDELETVYNPAN